MGRKKKEDTNEVNVLQTDNEFESVTPELKVITEKSNLVTISISNGNITKVIEQALFLGKLGGKSTPRFLPRLKSAPYIIKVDLTPEAAEQYASGEGKASYKDDVNYNKAVVRSPDPLRFLQAVLDIGAKGGIIVPAKAVQTGTTIAVPVLFEGLIETNPTINVLP